MIIERNGLKESFFKKITVHKSSINDAIKMFGNNYRISEHNNFSRQYSYEALGLSFYYKIEDPKKTIFVVKIRYPFSGKTS